ncbi:CHAP domain-containing protein [Swingsia samuiensis]|uniref:CHAP domain-containing protein n=1 Tax=Swingsia samuiensis TaxID=1293412 RepID=A0A4Y6UHA4_9PROT|nr:CHAP domain-containing protein [Swingsia samuiensis]QDH16969.1 CHAP domain-containing protein [Swingsia samuiensis]
MPNSSYRKSFFATLILSLVVFFSSSAQARHFRGSHNHRSSKHAHRFFGGFRHRSFSYARVLQCVAFAKQESNVILHGNARDWWYNAAGVYARGSAPEVGSVLNFRGIRRMPLGHVAIVRSVANSRTIYIDQSHWASNGISRNVRVIDVSPNNDWSAVRVALNNSGGSRLGSIYPTYGFIYARGDDGRNPSHVVIARSHATRFRHHAVLPSFNTSEVAEAPDDNTFPVDAPNRSIR